MFELRPLCVVTGTLKIEGGAVTETIKSTGSGAHTEVVKTRDVVPARRVADVIVANYTRQLRRLRLMKTPFGQLFSADAYGEVQEVLDEASRAIAEFTKLHGGKKCVITNGYVLERLQGARLGTVQGWASMHAEAQTKLKVEAAA